MKTLRSASLLVASAAGLIAAVLPIRVQAQARPHPFVAALVLNPRHGTWWSAAYAGQSVQCQTVVRLADGRVLVAGGDARNGTTLKTAMIYTPWRSEWRPVSPLPAPECAAPGVLLKTGQVLIAGGSVDGSGHAARISQAAALYSPRTNKWKRLARLPYPVAGQAASLLPNGDVLEVGGLFQGAALQYSLRHNRWTQAATTPVAGVGLTATPLPNGRILVVGDITRSPVPVPHLSALLFDPVTSAWWRAGEPGPVRVWHTATLLNDGQVLIAGGQGAGPACVLYNPRGGTWSSTGSLLTARFMHSAALLADGRVLVAGGLADQGPNSPILSSTELYNPRTGTWSRGPVWPASQARRLQQAVLLPGKNVLFIGGTNAPPPTT